MAISTILYITLALLLALGFAFFQYLFRKPHKTRKDYIFFFLRFLSVFLLLLLLVNPKITSTDYEIEKPQLVILADNSSSISYLNEAENLSELSARLSEDRDINERFEVNKIGFGEVLNMNENLDFSASQTDIYTALNETGDIFSGKQTAVVLLTDGNQSRGRDFRYFKNNNNLEIFPVAIGDTTSYEDLSINRINSNKYAFLNNRFPVEIFVKYSGNRPLTTRLNILTGNNSIVYTQKLEFKEGLNSQVIRTALPANSLGVKNYKVEIEGISDEKNSINNQQNFAVEVIDQRTSVLILSDIRHPDLGALKKAIESNQQRSSDIKYLSEENIQISKYQLIVLYQLNRRFSSFISEILNDNHNYLMITGSETDWNYLNSLQLGYQKNSTTQPQEIFPVYNSSFGSFQFEDIGFNDFPPLVDKFGPLEVENNQFNVMLFQEIQGVETGEPLLAVSQNTPKSGFLLGENIWRWRAKSYLDNQSFQEFDDFFGKLIQNLASNRSRDRLTIENESFYYANENVMITAQYFDENYQFDPGADLSITVTNNESEESFTSDLVLKNNYYLFDAGDLPAGNYSFTVTVKNKSLSKSGSFEVIRYNTEQQFVSANLAGLQTFAENNQTKLFFPDQIEELNNLLLQSDKWRPVQKSRQKNVPLIDWYYLLFILILILAAEWFYRKYLGLI